MSPNDPTADSTTTVAGEVVIVWVAPPRAVTVMVEPSLVATTPMTKGALVTNDGAGVVAASVSMVPVEAVGAAGPGRAAGGGGRIRITVAARSPSVARAPVATIRSPTAASL